MDISLKSSWPNVFATRIKLKGNKEFMRQFRQLIEIGRDPQRLLGKNTKCLGGQLDLSRRIAWEFLDFVQRKLSSRRFPQTKLRC